MIYGEPTLEDSSIEYQDIVGKLNRSNTTDENYETLTISESSHSPSELTRFGVMRLTEVCFDWHFNIVDPENIVIKNTTIPNFVYSAHSSIDYTTAGTEATVNGTMVYASGSPDTLKVQCSANTFSAGEYAFYPDGNMLGKISSISSGDLVFNIGAGQDNPNGLNSDTDGNFPDGSNVTKLHRRIPTYLTGNETINTIVKGQGKEDTLHNMKGNRSTPKQNEGFQMYKGGVFSTETATFKHDNVNYKSSQTNHQALQIPFYLEQKTTGSYQYLNALIFQNDGFLLLSMEIIKKLLVVY